MRLLVKNNICTLIALQCIYNVPVYAEKYTSSATDSVIGRAPVVSSLAFDPLTPYLGEEVKLSYIFSDEDGDLEQVTTVQWLRDGVLIQGATAFSYTLDEAKGDRLGQRLSAEVTPRTDPNFSEPSVGQVASLELTVASNANAPLQVTVTDITGTLTVGSMLAGVYEYQDGGSGSKDASIKSSLNDGHADTDNDYTYLLSDVDAGLVLTFQVQAKNL